MSDYYDKALKTADSLGETAADASSIKYLVAQAYMRGFDDGLTQARELAIALIQSTQQEKSKEDKKPDWGFDK